VHVGKHPVVENSAHLVIGTFCPMLRRTAGETRTVNAPAPRSTFAFTSKSTTTTTATFFVREPKLGACELDKRQVVACCLFVSRRDCAEALEIEEEDLDDVALAVQCTVQTVLVFPFGLRMNDRFDVSSPHLADKRIGVVARVANERGTSSKVEKLGRLGHFMALSLGERDVNRAAFRVDNSVELR